MKRYIFILCLLSVYTFSFLSCNDTKTENLRRELDSLKTKMNNVYKPGLGEFMLAVQTHHSKLRFAGTNENWPLAEFEVGEIKETLDNAIKYLPERNETKDIPMVFPALDSLGAAVKNKDLKMFTRNYKTLSQTCNDCHKAVHFEFNVIKTPSFVPVGDQQFETNKK